MWCYFINVLRVKSHVLTFIQMIHNLYIAYYKYAGVFWYKHGCVFLLQLWDTESGYPIHHFSSPRSREFIAMKCLLPPQPVAVVATNDLSLRYDPDTGQRTVSWFQGLKTNDMFVGVLFIKGHLCKADGNIWKITCTMLNFSQLQITVTSLLHHTGSLTSGQGLYNILGDFNSALEVGGTNYLQLWFYHSFLICTCQVLYGAWRVEITGWQWGPIMGQSTL